MVARNKENCKSGNGCVWHLVGSQKVSFRYVCNGPVFTVVWFNGAMLDIKKEIGVLPSMFQGFSWEPFLEYSFCHLVYYSFH